VPKAYKEPQEPLVLPVYKDQPVVLELRELKDLLGPQALQVLQDPQVQLDLRVLQD